LYKQTDDTGLGSTITFCFIARQKTLGMGCWTRERLRSCWSIVKCRNWMACAKPSSFLLSFMLFMKLIVVFYGH